MKKTKQNQPANPAPPSSPEDVPTAPIEVVNSEALRAIESAEIDVQISTAKRWPRSIDKFLQTAKTIACQDDDVAEDCIYNRPVGKKDGRMQFATGMSIRMAEIAASCFQNIRVAAILIENNERFVRARGMAHDLENNVASSSEVVESTVTREGTPYSERMRFVICKAALAKARRDAVFSVIPRGLLRPVEVAVREVLAGDRKNLNDRRKKALQWIADQKIDPARVFAALGIQGENGLDVKTLEVLTGIRTAIRDGDVSINEAFPALAGTAAPAASSAPKPLFEAGQAAKTAGAPPPADQTNPPGPAKTDQPPARVYSAEERTKIIDAVENGMLDLKIDEATVFKHLKNLNVVPAGIDELFTLPTGVLADYLQSILPNLTVRPS